MMARISLFWSKKKAKILEGAVAIFEIGVSAQGARLFLTDAQANQLRSERVQDVFVIDEGLDRLAQKLRRHVAVRSVDYRLRGGGHRERCQAKQGRHEQCRAPAPII